MTTSPTKAAEIVEEHIGAEVTIEGSTITIHKNLSASEMAALGNRLEYRYADLSGDTAMIALEQELHFIQIDYGDFQAVMASSPEDAMEKLQTDEYQDPTHYCSESDLKDYLKENEVVYL